jgi:ABC-2 type transport system ATP-binding protein
LDDRRRSLVRNLSKGMKQRLGLAQALVHQPQVIILDEPTIGIDPRQVIEVREAVRELGNDHTVIFSTHILSEAEQVCDRVVILNRGEIIAQGKPDEMRRQLERGQSLYVALGKLKPDDAAKLLSGVQGVRAVEPQGAGFVLRVQQGVDARAAIAKRVHEGGATLLELRPVAMTLEDIFLDLVERQEGHA